MKFPTEIIVFFCFSVLAIIIAAKYNFFYIEREKKIDINFKELFVVFFIYFGSNILIYPLINKFISSNIISSFTLNLMVFIVFSIIIFKKKLFFNLSNLKKDIKVGFFSCFLAFPIFMFIFSIINFVIEELFKIKNIPNQVAIEYLKHTYNTPYFFLAVIIIILFAPFIEELLFRGFLQSFLKNYFSYKTSIFITSFLFSIFHFSNSQKISNIPILITLFFLGSFLGFLFEKQKSLTSPIVLHATFNSLNILNFILLKKYLGVF